jgi:uncharacterized protein (DUF3084 family)
MKLGALLGLLAGFGTGASLIHVIDAAQIRDIKKASAELVEADSRLEANAAVLQRSADELDAADQQLKSADSRLQKSCRDLEDTAAAYLQKVK